MFKKDMSGKILGDRDLQKIIGTLLRFGVITASVIALLGGIIYLFVHGMEVRPAYNTFHGEPSAYTSLGGIIDKVLSIDARGIMQLGTVVLIMTPILRVVCSLFSFAVERDRLYVVITLVVLSVILFSMFSGIKI